MMKQVTEAPVPVRERQPTVPKDLETIVMRLLEKDPARRFASGGEVVAALDGAPVAPLVVEPEAPPPPKYVMDATGIGGHGVPPVQPHDETLTRKEIRQLRRAERRARTLPDRVRKFRGSLFSYGGTTVMLFGINWFTNGGHYWWAVFPRAGDGACDVSRGCRNDGRRGRAFFESRLGEAAAAHASWKPTDTGYRGRR
jgi:hypothetical protein